MGRRLTNNFKKRFGERKFTVVYPQKPLEGAARRLHNEKIAQAFVFVLAGILGREPRANEISGREEVFLKPKACK